ncbi:MAG TPA: type VI secretion system tip protein TssI/VgrG [Burkholderiaceae bacterium]|jgi:type VI secretion system VgrG family protein
MLDALQSATNSLRALLANYTQENRLFSLTTSLGANKLLIEHIEGDEGLSQSYHFEITVLSTDAHLDLKQLLGQPALLEIQTQHSRDDLRPIHGHITAFELLSADGGFARYRLTLQPWTTFLRYRFDSYVWQSKTTLDIVAEIFGDYQGQGKLAPAWRIAVADPSKYAVRDVCTQFEESDWEFVERLLAEEGLFYWFEHTGDTHGEALGTHTLVISDNNTAFTPNAQSEIRFHRAASVEKSDSITSWHATRQLVTNSIAVASWNESQVNVISSQLDSSHNSGDVPTLLSTDFPGQSHFDSREQVERAAQIHLEAVEARNKTYTGTSTVRTLSPGTTFTLTDHGIHDLDRLTGGNSNATYVVVSVKHKGRNNLSSDVHTLTKGTWGNSLTHLANAANPAEDEPLYQNEFSTLRADIPWRPLTEDGHGALLHPKPNVHGIHTAIVVGASGQDLTTERDHKIKVQMHWQRGAQSHSRAAHPQGADNAPGNEGAYIWVRVAETAAGANWGSSFVPRIGQEVVLDYIEGDIDRPIVVGSLYNGKGQDDAQGNQISQGAGTASGNAPAWFAGSIDDHAHNAIMAGFKTQEISNSQDGQGGYNALVLDDSPNQVGARLQSTKTKAQLNLGHIKRQTDNQRQDSHGHGAELTTDAYGALRAGQGVLLSADLRANASGTQMDASEAITQLQQAHNLQTTFADTAQKHNAFVGKSFNKDQHTSPETMLKRPIESLGQTNQGIGTAEGGGAGTVPAFGRPDLVASAPGGIALLTPNDAHATASSLTIIGRQDVSTTVGANYAAAVKSGISLFTYGDAKAKRSDKGIKLHAASGKVDLQAQSAELKAAADKDVNISSNAKVEAAASEHVLLTAGGAYVKIEGGSIQIHAPGSVQFKAGQKNLSGPASMAGASASLPVASELYLKPTEEPHSLRFTALGADELLGLSGWAGHLYSIKDSEGKTVSQGTVPEDGRLPRVTSDHTQLHILRLGDPKSAQLVPQPAIEIDQPTLHDEDEETDDDGTETSDVGQHDDDIHTVPEVIGNRYFQEVLDATSHHGTEFLSESDLAEFVNKSNAS